APRRPAVGRLRGLAEVQAERAALVPLALVQKRPAAPRVKDHAHVKLGVRLEAANGRDLVRVVVVLNRAVRVAAAGPALFEAALRDVLLDEHARQVLRPPGAHPGLGAVTDDGRLLGLAGGARILAVAEREPRPHAFFLALFVDRRGDALEAGEVHLDRPFRAVA